MKYHAFMIVSLVFSVRIKICNSLQFHAKNDFRENKLLLENTQPFLSKETNWVLMVKSFVGTSPVRNEFGIRMVNSFKVIISNKFQKHSKKYLPQFLQFQFKSRAGFENIHIPSSNHFNDSCWSRCPPLGYDLRYSIMRLN